MKLGKWRVTPGTELGDCGAGQTFPHPSARAIETHFLVQQTGAKEKSRWGIRIQEGVQDPWTLAITT